MKFFWYLIEDFSEHSWTMKAFIAWGWLSVIIMLAGIAVTDWGKLA